MKYQVTHFKDLRIALQELAPYVKSGKHLLNGRPFKQFGDLLSREMLANWLLCVVSNFAHGVDRKTFTSTNRELGGDGIIWDHVAQDGIITEHVMVPPRRGDETAEALILDKINEKRAKGGVAYAAGKTLVVFLEANAGVWYPNTVAKQLLEPLCFDEVWVVGLQGVDTGAYVYAATLLDVSDGDAPTWVVRIESDFSGWTVGRVQ